MPSAAVSMASWMPIASGLYARIDFGHLVSIQIRAALAAALRDSVGVVMGAWSL